MCIHIYLISKFSKFVKHFCDGMYSLFRVNLKLPMIFDGKLTIIKQICLWYIVKQVSRPPYSRSLAKGNKTATNIRVVVNPSYGWRMGVRRNTDRCRGHTNPGGVSSKHLPLIHINSLHRMYC